MLALRVGWGTRLVCAAPLPLPNPWDAKTLYGLLALFASNKGESIDGLLTLWLPDSQHEAEAS